MFTLAPLAISDCTCSMSPSTAAACNGVVNLVGFSLHPSAKNVNTKIKQESLFKLIFLYPPNNKADTWVKVTDFFIDYIRRSILEQQSSTLSTSGAIKRSIFLA